MSNVVYALWNVVTRTPYIGSTTQFLARLDQHFGRLRRGTHHSLKLQNAWNKYGEVAFVVLILDAVADREALAEREQHFLDTTPKSYNICPTAYSRIGYRHSDETRAKMSLAQRGRYFSDETRRKLSDAKRGRPLTVEHRLAISKASKGQARGSPSQETRDRIAASLRGRSPSQATRAKMRKANLGKVLSPEHRRKMSESQKARWARRRAAP